MSNRKENYQNDNVKKHINPITLGDGGPLSNDLQPLKVGGEASPIEVSTSLPDNSDNGKVVIKGDLEVTGTTKGIDTDTDTNTTYTVSTVDHASSASKKHIRLTGSDSSTDDVTLVAGTGITLAQSSDEITITNSVTDTDTVLTTEQVQDIVGAMVSGNTETNIAVTYDDTAGKIDFASTDTNTQLDKAGVESLGIQTVGTITTGTWNGTAIASAYLDSDTAHLSGTQTFTGEKTFNADVNFNATKNIYFDGSGGQNVYINAANSSTFNIGVDGEDKITITDSEIQFGQNNFMLPERSNAGSDTAGKGQIWVKNDAPNNLYFTDDTGQDIAITANGHLAQKHIIQINARVYNRYNYWFYPTFTWGTNAENWNSTRNSASLETTWFDSWNPILVVPHNMTLNEYYMYGNSTATHTIEHALLHGTGVTWDDTNADNFSLAQIGSTQSGAWTSGRYNDLGQTGLSVDLAKGDMIMPAFRRTTGDTSSTYSYLEICFVAVCTLR
jgi:hypothetical protein